MTTISDISKKLVDNLTLLEQDLTEVGTAAGAAALQYKQLTSSSEKATINSSINGLDIVGSFAETISPDGNNKSAGLAVFSDNLGTFGSLTSATNGALLAKTVTAATPDAAGAAFRNQFNGVLDNKTLFEVSLVASEALADSTGLPLGSSSKNLVNDAGVALIAKSNSMRTKIGTTDSLLEDITNDVNIQKNVTVNAVFANLIGNPSVPIVDFNNVPPRTFLQTYEEMEAYVRSSTRELTEVVVHATDTSKDMEVNYDVLYAWDVIGREFSEVGYHLIILRDGSLQVCRPISTIGLHTLNEHNPNSIGIAFVGGLLGTRKGNSIIRSHKSYSMEQFNTFDTFMRAFYTVIPGGQAWGHNNIDQNRRSDPHFDVPQYVQKKFNKFNTQTLEETRRDGSMTIDELIEAQY